MENHLKQLNGVLGVVGSFVCLPDGSVAAKALPDKYATESVETAARLATQTLNALDVSGQRVTDADLVYEQGRLVLKNLRGGFLVIVCTRNINIPLLNLTANVAAKKLAAELKPAKPKESAAKPAAAVPAPAVPLPAVAPTVPSVAPSELFTELEQETNRLLESAKNSQIVLCAIDPVSVWQCCPQTRRLVAAPEKRQLDVVGRAADGASITRLFQRLGYQPNQRFNEMYGTRQLNFIDSIRNISADIYLDAFEMYHRLDLTAVLAQSLTMLPETPIALIRLQLVDATDAALGDLCALLLEHDLSVGPQKEGIDASHLTRLCADDWGWYKTVMLNLGRLVAFGQAKLALSESSTIGERVRQLRQSIEGAPKSLRWQTRARLGEGVRWYETPLKMSTGRPSGRPDLAMG